MKKLCVIAVLTAALAGGTLNLLRRRPSKT